MAYNLGVDLGTTFVAAAVAYPSRIEMATLGDRSVVAPSVVYVREDGELVTGDAAGRRSVSNPDRVGREFKRRLGDPTPVMLGGAPHAVTALLGALLRDAVGTIVETEGRPPERVVLTHPANWGPFRRGLFEEVPHLAGLSDVTLVSEPEAAAAHYASTRDLAEGETIAVYDLGGGTFDATVLRKRGDGVEILGTPEGIERLGGVDFDEAILAHVNVAADGALSELDLTDPQTTVALARLRQDCVLAKEALSVDTEVVLPVFLPGRHFDVRLTRAEFEDMVRAPIESTIGALSRTLRSAGVDRGELSAVLLVGGSSRIPLVARMVAEELGRPTVVDTHPKYAVALGAATLAGAPATNGRAGDPAAVSSPQPASPQPASAPAAVGAQHPASDPVATRPGIPRQGPPPSVPQPPPRTTPRPPAAAPPSPGLVASSPSPAQSPFAPGRAAPPGPAVPLPFATDPVTARIPSAPPAPRPPMGPPRAGGQYPPSPSASPGAPPSSRPASPGMAPPGAPRPPSAPPALAPRLPAVRPPAEPTPTPPQPSPAPGRRASIWQLIGLGALALAAAVAVVIATIIIINSISARSARSNSFGSINAPAPRAVSSVPRVGVLGTPSRDLGSWA